MTEPAKPITQLAERLIGQRFYISDIGHPHHGSSGKLVALDETLWGGLGARFELDGGGGCYIFDLKSIRPERRGND